MACKDQNQGRKKTRRTLSTSWKTRLFLHSGTAHRRDPITNMNMDLRRRQLCGITKMATIHQNWNNSNKNTWGKNRSEHKGQVMLFFLLCSCFAVFDSCVNESTSSPFDRTAPVTAQRLPR